MFPSGGENFTEGKFLYGIYPYSKNSSLKDGIATISLPFRQNSAEGTFVNGLLPTIARSQNFKLAFYNICGGVVFTLSRNDITSIRFRGNNGERIAGRAKVAFDELGRPVVLDEEVESKGEITLYPPEGGTFKANEKYYIAAYPASLQSVLPLHYGLQECKKEYVWEISPLKSGVLL